MNLDERSLEVAEEVAATCAKHGIRVAVIGAVALALRNYPRQTEDVDLASFADPRDLASVARDLAAMGYEVTFDPPDAEDPLGGVLRVTGDFRTVELVNFYNPLGKAEDCGRMAIEEAEPNALGTLAVARVPHLVALKLHAGTTGKPYADILELLARNPDVDIRALREYCERVGKGRELDEVLRRRVKA
jgi:hypothetical protein